MTLVGTVKANKSEIPQVMKSKENHVSFLPDEASKKKVVLLLSSMHIQPSIGPTENLKWLDFKTKQRWCWYFWPDVHSDGCGRKTKKWPLCVFYGMIIVGVNSWIIHNKNAVKRGDNQMQRRHYMQALAPALIKPLEEQRLPSSNLTRQLTVLICNMLDIPTLVTLAGKSGPAVAESSIPLVRCADCSTGLDRKCVRAIITLRVLTACKECCQ